MVSERIRTHGSREAVIGDLVFINAEAADKEDQETEEDSEDKVAEEKVVAQEEDTEEGVSSTQCPPPPCMTDMLYPSLPARINQTSKAEAQAAASLSSVRGPRWKEGEQRGAQVKCLTAEDVGQYSIFDVVMPTPGWDVVYPEALGDKYRELMKLDGLDPDDLRRPQK